jgi:hypothetical protein
MADVAMESEGKAAGGWAAAAHLGVVMWDGPENAPSHPEMLLSYVDLYLL